MDAQELDPDTVAPPKPAPDMDTDPVGWLVWVMDEMGLPDSADTFDARLAFQRGKMVVATHLIRAACATRRVRGRG